MGRSALKRRERSRCRGVACRQLSRPHAQQRHHIGRATERIRDWRAAVERKRRLETAVDLGDQHLAGGDTGAVELGQSLEAIRVGRGREPEDDV